jgi:hypothetical protein
MVIPMLPWPSRSLTIFGCTPARRYSVALSVPERADDWWHRVAQVARRGRQLTNELAGQPLRMAEPAVPSAKDVHIVMGEAERHRATLCPMGLPCAESQGIEVDDPRASGLRWPDLQPLPLAPVSVSQQNAQQKTEDYLAYTAFSRTGLIQQLEFEGFSAADATWAVDHVTVNWNQQAAAKAKEYLVYTSFSRSGLIQQLEFEGFTPAQAQYGVSQPGL